MPVFAKYKLKVLLFLVVIPASVLAQEANVAIENVRVYQQQQHYWLDADVNFQLSPAVEQALRNGVSLVWAMQYKVWQKRTFFWDTTIVNSTDFYLIRYHALLGMFQIRDEQNQTLKRFISLRAAFSYLGKIRGHKIISQKQLQDDSSYEGRLIVALDKERLPLPLRVVAYIDSAWSLQSRSPRWLLAQ